MRCAGRGQKTNKTEKAEQISSDMFTLPSSSSRPPQIVWAQQLPWSVFSQASPAKVYLSLLRDRASFSCSLRIHADAVNNRVCPCIFLHLFLYHYYCQVSRIFFVGPLTVWHDFFSRDFPVSVRLCSFKLKFSNICHLFDSFDCIQMTYSYLRNKKLSSTYFCGDFNASMLSEH